MIALKGLPNNITTQRMLEQHTLELPDCCPVSKNPRPGSKVTISYRAKEMVLDITPLYAYIHQFVGGLRTETGELDVRDMEGMLLRIAHDCAQVVRVPVRVTAQLYVLPKQEMKIVARGYPRDVND
ncbi:hypothetical protein KSC_002250 [Ktedonobacter sp. SOSP1-52]|uniref:hypothetical protein n=1 Tax=Ktedonobacter sp. SOSP1-52 TaxID=2778366 RepID=UPI001915F5ED|nr:hypothetical protein [Ktedonobacter sp. SOSP1-52]GHO61333.1 hypothetical protein KSC_002250 [Ktedonobacter sp. SOSP1-52]